MKKQCLLVFLLTYAVTQGFLYLGKSIGRDENKNKIETLEHRVDSLRIENAKIANDVIYWETKCKKYE